MEGERSRKLHVFTVILFLMSCLALPKGTDADTKCPDGGYYFNDGVVEYCINLVHQAMSWQEADAYCKTYDVDNVNVLYSPNSVDRSRALASAIQREEGGDGNYWISPNDVSNEGVFQWLDNSEIAYSNWFHDEPNNANEEENCVHVSASLDYQWNDRDCDIPTEFACQTTPLEDGAPAFECQEGWSNHKGRCFKVFDSVPLGWDQAQEQCQEEIGANLAAITSHEVHQFITESDDLSLAYGESYWIGLNDKETEGEYRWLDASAQTAFTFWKRHEPNDADNDQDCVRMQGNSNFRWNDAQCNLESFYICERPLIAMI